MTPKPRALLAALVASCLLPSARLVADEPTTPVLDVFPTLIRLYGADARQQLAATLASPRADEDVTAKAAYSVVPPSLAHVSRSGVVTPTADGAGVVRVSFGGHTREVSLTVERHSTTRPASYRHDVTALLSKAGCNMGACHGNLNGKGGFKLSLRGFDPDFDFAALTRESFGRRVDRLSPESSLIVQKATGRLPHEGGLRFPAASPEARALLAWIAAGALNDAKDAPRVVKLDVYPPQRMIRPGRLSQQLVVTAELSDGTRRDVTRQAAYDVSDPTRATVDADGRVEVRGPTETAVAVRYLDGRAVSRLAFLADRPGFVARKLPRKNFIDEHVFNKLERLGVNPSEIAPDAVFIRRAYLDAVGRLPDAEETRRFLADESPDKRSKLIQRLLDRPEFADFWALKWADLLRNEEKQMGDKGVWVFQRWLRDQFAADVPLDEFARSLLTSRGSTYSNPAASYYRTNRDPNTAAETFGQVFLGVRLQCARCHNHPFDNWTQDDYYGLAATFANVRQKQVANVRKDSFDKHEIQGDEYIYLDGAPATPHPRTGEMMSPKAPNGPKAVVNGRGDAREALADWLTRSNRQFARNLANRVWFHLLGRGVVHPVDDFRESNPPSNPELLEALTDELVAGGYRLRPLVARIMESTAYQLSAPPDETNADDEANFARAYVRLLPAEVLLDAIGQVLDRPGGFSDAPRDARAAQLPGARMGGAFLKVFGKPDRLLTCECERSESTTLAQAFQLINGDSVRYKLESSENRIARRLAANATDDALLDELTLAALSREPTASERAGFLEHVRRATDKRKAWEDVAWAILNSKEFLLRH